MANSKYLSILITPRRAQECSDSTLSAVLMRRVGDTSRASWPGKEPLSPSGRVVMHVQFQQGTLAASVTSVPQWLALKQGLIGALRATPPTVCDVCIAHCLEGASLCSASWVSMGCSKGTRRVDQWAVSDRIVHSEHDLGRAESMS